MNIVVTGASSGIGYQSALWLADQSGHRVIAVSRNKEKLDRLKSESLSRKSPSKLDIIAGDISDEKGAGKITSEISSQVDHIHVLINNAGLLINKPFDDLTSDDWTAVYSTNVFGAVNMIRNLLPLFSAPMKEVHGLKAHILNISSMGGFQGSVKFNGLSAYSSSKAAIAGITECLAEEFKDREIAVNCLCLGSVQTEMFSAAFPGFKASATANEMAAFVARFALEGQKFFNGKIIPVSNSTP